MGAVVYNALTSKRLTSKLKGARGKRVEGRGRALERGMWLFEREKGSKGAKSDK